MKKFLSAIAVFAMITGCGNNGPVPSIYEFTNSINKDILYTDLAVLADDSMAGRETGTEDLKKAADYLADRYKALGIEAVGDDGSYFQYFDLVQPVTNGYTYTLTKDGQVVDQSVLNEEETGNFFTSFGGDGVTEGDIVFAGYGIYDEEKGIDQYPEEFQGKWIMIISERGVSNTRRMQSLISDGAAGAIFVSEIGSPMAFESDVTGMQNRIGNQGRLSLAYLQNNGESTSAYTYINPELAATILGYDMNQVVRMARSLEQNPADFEPIETGFNLRHEADIDNNVTTTQNVVAFIEGSDPDLKDEIVVLSAHYDHVGIGRPDSTGDTIYNGADDDGSGTVATLITAQTLMAAKEAGAGPKRSVLFLHVSGEEKGLLGSRYYSDHPIYSIENTIANVNIDMIGRIDPEYEGEEEYIYVIGGEIISSGVDSLTRVANELGPNIVLSKKYNDLEDRNQFYRRSDHWNFGRLGVPFIFLFNGTHEDYHRPSDELDKIAWDSYVLRTRLAFNLTAELANTDIRPVVDNQAFIEKTQVEPRN